MTWLSEVGNIAPHLSQNRESSLSASPHDGQAIMRRPHRFVHPWGLNAFAKLLMVVLSASQLRPPSRSVESRIMLCWP